MKIIVSRYNNRQLTIYSKQYMLKQATHSSILIPFPNTLKLEPIILNTILNDNKIFSLLDECFQNKQREFLRSHLDSPKNRTTINENKVQKEHYLPIIYNKNYVYSIAKNVEELQLIHPVELNYIYNEHDVQQYLNKDFGFIILNIINTILIPPLAILTYIEENKFFIPIELIYQSRIHIQTPTPTPSSSKNHHFFKWYLDKLHNTSQSFIHMFYSSDDAVIDSCNHIQKKKNSIQSHESHESHESRNSSLSSLSSENNNDTEYTLFVLHTTDTFYNNGINDFKSNIRYFSFAQYLKSCSSTKMCKIKTSQICHCKNIWMNIECIPEDIFIY